LAAVNDFGGGAQLLIFESEDMSVLAGRAVGHEVLAKPKGDRPDAIFASNDLLAMGLVQAFMFNSAIAIPQEIALIGYDDIDFAQSAVVPLSSIRQPSKLLGETAVELLLDEVDNPGEHTHRQVRFQPELVVRTSTSG
jgi:LacI family transcriptional regulator